MWHFSAMATYYRLPGDRTISNNAVSSVTIGWAGFVAYMPIVHVKHTSYGHGSILNSRETVMKYLPPTLSARSACVENQHERILPDLWQNGRRDLLMLDPREDFDDYRQPIWAVGSDLATVQDVARETNRSCSQQSGSCDRTRRAFEPLENLSHRDSPANGTLAAFWTIGDPSCNECDACGAPWRHTSLQPLRPGGRASPRRSLDEKRAMKPYDVLQRPSA